MKKEKKLTPEQLTQIRELKNNPVDRRNEEERIERLKEDEKNGKLSSEQIDKLREAENIIEQLKNK